MADAAASGAPGVVVAPVQFLGDHLETLYDIDVAARAQADAVGLGFRRVRALDTDAGLIEALASAARKTLASDRPGGELVPASSSSAERG
jgi:ferrochelatase